MQQVPRRTVLTATGIAAGQVALGLPTAEGEESDSQAKQKIKVVVTGGHPDDPETGCGGTIARYTQQDHEVVVLYLTRGEAGVKGKTHEEAAAIRTEECQRACLILGAHPNLQAKLIVTRKSIYSVTKNSVNFWPKNHPTWFLRTGRFVNKTIAKRTC